MKNKIKLLLHKLGIYDMARKLIIKVYYPLKTYRINKNAKDILLRIKPVLEECAQDWWLDYGTLLGCVREGKIISHDIDLDFGVLLKDNLSDDGSFQKSMEQAGFVLINKTTVEGVVTMEQYHINDIGFDIFYYRKENDKLVTNIWYGTYTIMPKRIAYEKNTGYLSETTFTYTDTKTVKFYEVDCQIPTNYDLYLKEHFGGDYMTPNPNFSHDEERNRVAVEKEYRMYFYE